MTRHRNDPELTTCRDCGGDFDLARQSYYENICPRCRNADS